MKRPLLLWLPLLSLAWQAQAHASVGIGECKNYDGTITVIGTVEIYASHANASPLDPRSSEVYRPLPYPATGSTPIGRQVRLEGYLFMPSIPSGQTRPAIVYNHGYSSVKPPCAVVLEFLKRGFIVFAPLRRGQGNSNPDTTQYLDDGVPKSTGIFTSLWVDQQCAARSTPCTDADRDAIELAYVEASSADVGLAMTWLKAQPGVAPGMIALLGHSYGGITVLLANQTDSGQRAVIDVSGAGLSWISDASLRAGLPPAVHAGKAPIFFLQPRNERSIEPTRVLSKAAYDVGLVSLAGIYPDVPNVNDVADEVHKAFIMDPCQVVKWMPDAIDFLSRQGVAAPPMMSIAACPARIP